MARKRPAAAVGDQTPPSLGPVWQWRCNVHHQASCLGVEPPDAFGAYMAGYKAHPELVEALQPGTVQASAVLVSGGRAQRRVSAKFEMPPHASHILTYRFDAHILEAHVRVFGPREPPGVGAGRADDRGALGGAGGGERRRISRKRPAAAG